MGYLIENVLQLVLSQGGTFHVFYCTQLFGHAFPLFFSNRLHLLLSQFIASARVLAKISLGADDQARDTGAVVMDFRKPFFSDVLKGSRRCDGKADQENVCLGVRERPQTVIILLTGSVEES